MLWLLVPSVLSAEFYTEFGPIPTRTLVSAASTAKACKAIGQGAVVAAMNPTEAAALTSLCGAWRAGDLPRYPPRWLPMRSARRGT